MEFDAFFVEPLAACIFAVAQALGGNVGAAVIVVSVTARLLMLPISLKIAQRSVLHRRAMAEIQPQLMKLRKRFAGNPHRLARESAWLFERHGVQPVDAGSFGAALAQAPVFIALWTAVRKVSETGGRFLWIADLGRPDLWLTLLATAFTGWGVSMGIDGQEVPKLVLILPMVLTLIMLWKASAGLGLYWASSSLVGAVQSRWIRRWAETHAPAAA